MAFNRKVFDDLELRCYRSSGGGRVVYKASAKKRRFLKKSWNKIDRRDARDEIRQELE